MEQLNLASRTLCARHYLFSNQKVMLSINSSVDNGQVMYTSRKRNASSSSPIHLELLVLTYVNSGHFLSEFIGSFRAWREFQHKANYYIGIPQVFKDHFPLVYDLCGAVLDHHKMKWKFIQNDEYYNVIELSVYRSPNLNYNVRHDWFPYTKKFWSDRDKDMLVFDSLGNGVNADLKEDITFLQEVVQDIYAKNFRKFDLYEKIIFIKHSQGTLKQNNFPSRYCQPMSITPENIKKLEDVTGFKFTRFSDFTCMEHMVCVFHYANRIITSYGATLCTNKWFYNEKARVLVLCNKSYKYQYNGSPNSRYFYLLHSHLCAVQKQVCLLDFPQHIDDEAIEAIHSVMNSINE